MNCAHLLISQFFLEVGNNWYSLTTNGLCHQQNAPHQRWISMGQPWIDRCFIIESSTQNFTNRRCAQIEHKLALGLYFFAGKLGLYWNFTVFMIIWTTRFARNGRFSCWFIIRYFLIAACFGLSKTRLDFAWFLFATAVGPPKNTDQPTFFLTQVLKKHNPRRRNQQVDCYK